MQNNINMRSEIKFLNLILNIANDKGTVFFCISFQKKNRHNFSDFFIHFLKSLLHSSVSSWSLQKLHTGKDSYAWTYSQNIPAPEGKWQSKWLCGWALYTGHISIAHCRFPPRWLWWDTAYLDLSCCFFFFFHVFLRKGKEFE